MLSLIYLVLLFIGALFFGKLAWRLNQPSIVGYIFGGLFFGPLFLVFLRFIDYLVGGDAIGNFISEIQPEAIESDLSFFMDVSIIIIMFAAGLETSVTVFKSAFKTGIMAASFGVIFPLVMGFAGSYLLTGNFTTSLFVGGALSITAVAPSVATLTNIDAVSTRFGMTIINASIDDDIIGIIIVSVMLGIAGVGSHLMPISIIGMILLSIGFVVLAIFVFPPIMTVLYKKAGDMGTAEGLGFSIIVASIFGFISNLMGLHFMIGAFLGGMATKGLLTPHVHKTLERISNGFFAPIFFAWVGYFITFSGAVFSPFIPVILAVGFFGKLIGAGLGSRISGLNWAESFLVGAGMNSRAGVELILMALALHRGIITEDIYSAIVLNGALMTLLTPIVLKNSYDLFVKKGWIPDPS
ncbi:MAG: cation:proton antiporter [Thermoplasmatota archaeon]